MIPHVVDHAHLLYTYTHTHSRTMADENAVEANGVSREEDPPTLETIDLDSSALEREETGQEKAPVLSFKGDEDDEEDSDQDDSSKKGGAAAGEGGAYKGGFIAGPEGTRQHKKQTRSISETTSSIKDWSITHIKMTRQVLSEQFGRATKTVDPDLEARVSAIRDTQKKYNDLTSLMGQLRFHMESVLNTQTSLAEHFGFLSVRCPELHTEFTFNSITQKRLVHNGKKLLAAMNYFIANVYTVSSKAIEDTLLTAKTYESVRILHDAYRTDLEAAQKTASANQVRSSGWRVGPYSFLSANTCTSLVMSNTQTHEFDTKNVVGLFIQ